MALTGFADIAVSDSFIRFNLQTLSYLYVPFSVLLMLLIIGILYLKRDQTSPNVKDPSHCYSEDKPEVIIIGAGVLGSAMAVVLGREGRHVTVIERDLKQPDRIVGELLQPGGVKVLEELGLADCVEEIDAHTIKGYVIHDTCSKSSVQVPYPSEYDGIRGGRAFHHGRFIMRLRAAMHQLPTVQVIEGAVSKLLKNDNDNRITGVEYRMKDSETNEQIFAPLTIVADGCFSKFRKELTSETPAVKSHFVGFLMHNCPQAIANHAELVLCDPTPVLIYQVSSTCTRILVDIRGPLPKDLKHYLREFIYPQLPDHIKDPFLDGIENDRVRVMPNSFLPPAPIIRQGALCLGDAMNMRHPLTGGGMTVALNDVAMCQNLFTQIPDLADNDRVLKATKSLYLHRKNHHSFVVNVLAQALYELFAADDEYLKKMKHACFEYFQLGGACVSGPVGLLSILEPKPYILIGHFFAVAIYAIYGTVRRSSLFSIHRSLLTAIGILLSACRIIFPLMWSELKTVISPC